MVQHVIDVVEPLLVAAIIGLSGWVIHLLRQRHGRDVHREKQLGRLLELFEGEPADPLANRPATLGVLGQIAELRMAVAHLTVRLTNLEGEAAARGGRVDDSAVRQSDLAG
jgi:hypothetical protein